jgi:hypothetical protein
VVIENRVTNPAGGDSGLRASHADREQVIDVLKAAFVQGLLTKDEFDLRMSQAFAARTYAEVADVTADIPAGLIGVQPRRPGWPRAGKAAAWCAFGIVLPPLLAVAVVPGPVTDHHNRGHLSPFLGMRRVDDVRLAAAEALPQAATAGLAVSADWPVP